MATLQQRYVHEVPLGDLEPDEANPNVGDETGIVESIDALGFFGAVLAQEGTGTIIAGESRWRAAKAAGLPSVPSTGSARRWNCRPGMST